VLGIGLMGFPMARRLCEAGVAVRAWNRSRAKAERLLPFGASVCDSAADAVSGADLVITLVENGEAVEALLLGTATLDALRAGTLVVDMSSILLAQARGHAASLASRLVRHIDAPVSGGTVGADAGTLAIMAGGGSADVERARPLLELLELLELLGRLTHVGPYGAGQLAKLTNQMVVGIAIGAVAEALLMCKKGGADMGRVRQAMTGGFADSCILALHGERMVQRDFTKRAAMAVQLKDMRNALHTAQGMGFDAPVTTLFEQLFAQAVDHGLGDLDHSALFVELAQRNSMR